MPDLFARDNVEDKEIRYRAPFAHDTVEDLWNRKNIKRT